MGRVTRGTIRLLATAFMVLVAGCAESPDVEERARIGRGDRINLQTQNATAAGPVGCSAIPASSSVSSGEPFAVTVSLTRGTPPFNIDGFLSGVSGSSAEIWGVVTSASSTAVTATRRIRVSTAEGSAACFFTVTVAP